MNIPAEMITPLTYAAAGLGGVCAAVLVRAAVRRAVGVFAARRAAAKASPRAKAESSRSTRANAAAILPEYLLVSDHDAVVNVLKSDIAELRSTVVALEVRMHALKQRQDHQLEALSAGRDIEERSASFTADDLVALARQGWAARELARVAHLSMAEAELLTRLHGQGAASTAGARAG